MPESTLEKTYDPKVVEEKWYAHWESSGFFNAAARPGDAEAYCITIPPPNVTGELHMGHAIQHAIHDAVTRRKRMQGFETLCLPGTDHAGIATQMKVEQELAQEEGKTRYDIGRDELMERIWAWKERYGNTIYDQLRKLGCSYDWERSRFTLDEEYAEAVLKAFQHFHTNGWIYRGTRMINWCPSCGTVISDLETEEIEQQGHLWHIRYPSVDGELDVVVATTRPETMLGDTAVAVHPTDQRWLKAIGGRLRLPLTDREIPIVSDEYADPEMGSGAVKVTPAHDPNDYEIGLRHELEQIQVIDFDGSMTPAAGPYAGLDRYACRDQVVKALEAQGLLVKVEDHEHAVPHHDKCGTVIEPLPMEQWFMNMKPLAEKTRPYIESAEIEYVPERFRGYALEWLDDIRDWALSRQIWWGHRIPAWYCTGCSGEDGLIPLGGMTREQALSQGSFRVSMQAGAVPVVSTTRPEPCSKCSDGEWVRDPDVLDTWFSSALWPFATLGWPQNEKDLEFFFPTDLMITGRDILYLWVLRMAMTSLEFTGQIPFKTVLVHPTVQTKDGRRMSKSLGTGLNPLDLVELYGADATRYSLLHQAGSGQDIRFDAEIADNKVTSSLSARAGQNFCNKLWNAARFVLMNLEGYEAPDQPAKSEVLADRWIRSRLAFTIDQVSVLLDTYRFSDVTRTLYEFLWNDYCDWYLELAKLRLQGADEADRSLTQHVLVEAFEQALRLMHPVMPYITESVWQALPIDRSGEGGDSIMVAAWPSSRAIDHDEVAETEMAMLKDVVSSVRTIRSELNVPPGKKVQVVLSAATQADQADLIVVREYIAVLTNAEDVEIGVGLSQPPSSGSAVVGDLNVFVPLAGLIDLEAEKSRLMKEISKFQGLLKGLEKKLGQASFLEKAPPEVVERERQRQEEYTENLKKLEASFEVLSS
jgi:valyl-tRNA synthetase